MKHYRPVYRDRFIRQGARPEVAQFIVDQHEQKIMAGYTIYEIAIKMIESCTGEFLGSPRAEVPASEIRSCRRDFDKLHAGHR